MDFGWGGAAWLDSENIWSDSSNIWWSKSWSNSDTFGFVWDLEAGHHYFTLYGAEDCCDGK